MTPKSELVLMSPQLPSIRWRHRGGLPSNPPSPIIIVRTTVLQPMFVLHHKISHQRHGQDDVSGYKQVLCRLRHSGSSWLLPRVELPAC